MAATFGSEVRPETQHLVFAAYTADMRKVRHVHPYWPPDAYTVAAVLWAITGGLFAGS
jgi:hypothetical protein